MDFHKKLFQWYTSGKENPFHPNHFLPGLKGILNLWFSHFSLILHTGIIIRHQPFVHDFFPDFLWIVKVKWASFKKKFFLRTWSLPWLFDYLMRRIDLSYLCWVLKNVIIVFCLSVNWLCVSGIIFITQYVHVDFSMTSYLSNILWSLLLFPLLMVIPCLCCHGNMNWYYLESIYII